MAFAQLSPGSCCPVGLARSNPRQEAEFPRVPAASGALSFLAGDAVRDVPAGVMVRMMPLQVVFPRAYWQGLHVNG